MTETGEVLDLRDLPQDVPGPRTSIFAGMALFVVIEATVVASLLTSYYYVRAMARESWPPPGIELPGLLRPGISLLVLVMSVVPLLWARIVHRDRHRATFRMVMVLGMALLVGYLGIAFFELRSLPYDWTGHVYGSLVWTLSGYQLLHVVALLLLALGVLMLGSTQSGVPRDSAVSVVLLYWTFVVVVSVPSYFTLYLAPHLL